jgi:coenzyme Q-binding protein COQ10
MTKFTVTRHVPYSADQVYAIASDVACYREFLPLMKQSTVFNRANVTDGVDQFDAELVITYKKLGISETMRSKVKTDSTTRRVVASCVDDGPVRHLDATWHIVTAPQGGANIELDIDYTLKSKSLQFLLSGMFDLMMRKIMTAFEERARKLYGPAA